jgi:hypothetical protein
MRRFTFASMFALAVLGTALSNPMSAQAQDVAQAPIVTTPTAPAFTPPITAYTPSPEYQALVGTPILVPQPVIVNSPVYRPYYRSAYRYPVRAYRGGWVRRGYRRW